MTNPLFDSTGARVRHYTKGPPKARAKRTTPEAKFQKELVAALEIALPDPYMVFASMVGTNVGERKGADLKEMGVKADMADLQVLNLDTGGSRFLECKSLVGALRPGQRRMAERLGDKWATVRTLDQAEAALLRWHVPLRMPLRFADRYQAPMWARMSVAEQAVAWERSGTVQRASRYGGG